MASSSNNIKIIVERSEMENVYNLVQKHEAAIDRLRNQLNDISEKMDASQHAPLPLCIACSNPIEHIAGVGYAYEMESAIFEGIKRKYLVCIWCKETIMWNEIREKFLEDAKLSNFQLFADSLADDDDDE